MKEGYWIIIQMVLVVIICGGIYLKLESMRRTSVSMNEPLKDNICLIKIANNLCKQYDMVFDKIFWKSIEPNYIFYCDENIEEHKIGKPNWEEYKFTEKELKGCVE